MSNPECHREAQRLLEQIVDIPISDEQCLAVFLSSDLVDPKHGLAKIDSNFIPQDYPNSLINQRKSRRRRFDESVIQILSAFSQSELTIQNMISRLSNVNSNQIIRFCNPDADNLSQIICKLFQHYGPNEYWVHDTYTSIKGSTIVLFLPHYSGWGTRKGDSHQY